MSLIERAIIELGRRIALMPEEVALWKRSAAADAQQLGIHQSQLTALQCLMDGLALRQNNSLKDFAADAPLERFAKDHDELMTLIVGSQELWQAIRTIFAQRQDPTLAPIVEDADLIAADCYLTCVDQARRWGLIGDQQFREPPLTCLEASDSAATATRGHDFRALGRPIKYFKPFSDLRLPFPIILLPRDHAAWIWLFGLIPHEVGHNLDQVLQLRQEVSERLIARLTDQIPLPRIGVWGRWTAEVLADAFGVLLGGAGFAHTLAPFLLASAPITPEVGLIAGKHPHPWVRIALLAALLRGCRVPSLANSASMIDAIANRPERPAWSNDYLKDCDAVAEVLMDQPLSALGDRPLRLLIPDLPGDAERAKTLAAYLSSGLLRPDPNAPERFPRRLVPAAAQLAVAGLQRPTKTALDQIQDRAQNYLRAIHRPQWLSASASREEFLRQLVADLDFRSPSPLED